MKARLNELKIGDIASRANIDEALLGSMSEAELGCQLLPHILGEILALQPSTATSELKNNISDSVHLSGSEEHALGSVTAASRTKSSPPQQDSHTPETETNVSQKTEQMIPLLNSLLQKLDHSVTGTSRSGLIWFGLVWFGLVWSGLFVCLLVPLLVCFFCCCCFVGSCASMSCSFIFRVACVVVLFVMLRVFSVWFSLLL
jgi:hypothetical protein